MLRLYEKLTVDYAHNGVKKLCTDCARRENLAKNYVVEVECFWRRMLLIWIFVCPVFGRQNWIPDWECFGLVVSSSCWSRFSWPGLKNEKVQCSMLGWIWACSERILRWFSQLLWIIQVKWMITWTILKGIKQRTVKSQISKDQSEVRWLWTERDVNWLFSCEVSEESEVSYSLKWFYHRLKDQWFKWE